MIKSVKQAEQQHLNQIMAKIKLAELQQLKVLRKVERNERIIQKDFYNDVRLRSTTYSGLMETGVEVRQKQELLTQLNAQWRQARFFLKRLRLLHKNPYFARIDFVIPETKQRHTIYIGLASFADRNGHYLIYDWRAPISSIYYQNRMGQVSYQTPSGKRQVKIVLKRQFQIKNGELLTVFDTSTAIGDQLLLSNLSRKSTPEMRNIVSTIQRDQNQIIRDTHADLLYVQGAAGSGKTSAALQRVAYLLYHYRKRLNYRQIILFSPNQLFNDYVNHVLPSLGEHNMIRMTYYQYGDHRVPKLRVETLAERFAADNFTHRYQRVNHLKNSLACFKALTQYTRDLNRQGMHFNNLYFKQRLFISKQTIAKIYYSFNQNYDLRNRLDATQERLKQILHQRIRTEMNKKWVANAIEDMNRRQLRAIQLTHPNEFQNIDNTYAFLAKHIVLGAFRKLQTIINQNRFINLNRQYLHWLRRLPHYLSLSRWRISNQVWQAGVKTFVHDLDYGSISMADLTAYLYLHDLITGSYGHREIKYIFIDEAQDYTGFQMAFLHYEFPRARFTILADLNQAIFTHQESHDLFCDLQIIFKGLRVHRVQLNKSYRSTQQITDFSRALLPHGNQIKSFARQGDLPAIQTASDRGQELADLVQILHRNNTQCDTTAIIGKNLQQCRVVTRQLRQRHIKVHLIQTENQGLTSGILIVPAYLAKGLEFDAVVMWDASAHDYATSADLQLAYTICTRAMHRLDILCISQTSPLFKRIPARLYRQIR